MKKIKQYLMMLLAGFGATSCYYDRLPIDPVIPIPEAVSYTKDIQPLLDKDCISCHKPGATSPDLTAANSYNSLTANGKYVVQGDVAASKLLKSMLGDGAALMPVKGKWSDPKLEILKKWISDGALNN